ncbi:MAG: deoxyribonuclease IV [bacterium]|nr:deoxyribonuclease IV [bacterium]MDT8396000.1 deoxyribonuclease IV [bacterium]
MGAHESISGGFARSILRAVEDRCEVVQIFTGAPGRWKVPPVDPEAAESFKGAVAEHGIRAVHVHGAYLINPAGPDPELWKRSLAALGEEYLRCRALDVDGLIIHPGSHKGTSIEAGIERAAGMVGTLLSEYPEGPPVLLENTAGSGSVLGGPFSELAAIREASGAKDRVFFCFDTAHAFAAGYDLRDRKKVGGTMKRIDDEAGLAHVRAVHLNDTKKELGSGVDRHERIGEGFIGDDGFAALLAMEEFSSLPGFLETTPVPDAEGRYRPQVERLLGLRGARP